MDDSISRRSQMSDLIDRQDAIDALIKADYELTGILSEPRARMFEQTINALPSAQSDWIPCNEKLPEELTRVLVCTDQGFVCIAYLKACHKEKDRPWLVYGADPDVRGNIVKWMQLPKP